MNFDTFKKKAYAFLRSKEYVTIPPGGINGITTFFVLYEICEQSDTIWHKWIQSVKGFGGSSIGGIIAVILSCNPSPLDVLEFAKRVPLSKILKDHFRITSPEDILDHINHIRGGVLPGSMLAFLAIVILHRMTGRVDLTFEELYQHTKKEIRIETVGREYNKKYMMGTSHTPDMPVYLALRATASVPFLFAPVCIEGQMYFDGGIRNQNALGLFKEKENNTLSIVTVPDEMSILGKEKTRGTNISFSEVLRHYMISTWIENLVQTESNYSSLKPGIVLINQRGNCIEGLDLYNLSSEIFDLYSNHGIQSMKSWTVYRWILYKIMNKLNSSKLQQHT